MVQIRVFAWIRKCSDDGHEWIDLQTLSGDWQHCDQLADKIEKDCGPAWTRDNPRERRTNVTVAES